MRLEDILSGIKLKAKYDIAGLKVNSVSCDSRTVGSGDMFIAISGYSVDGHKFINEAISKGAKAIVAEKDFRAPKDVKKILLHDVRKALPVISKNFYRDPSSELKVIGITGTNGKTTVTFLIESILKKAGKEPGVIGTINYRFKNKRSSTKNTTPGPLELGTMLREMVDEGLDYAIMEVSSHSLDQHRVDGLSFDAGIFTNITSEHLDYHKRIKDYFDAKVKLFDRLKDGAVIILNNDDSKVASLKKRLVKRRVITYGLKEGADIRARSVKCSLSGSAFLVTTPKGSIAIETSLIGMHNISNILASVAAAFAEEVSLEIIKKGIESLESIPGRLEEIHSGQDFKVLVDYAHTEDALYNILSILRKVAKKHIITVFGCGGDRDRKKRPLMGKVACRFSDRVIITLDNPRFEEPRQIIREIENGIIKRRFSNYSIIEDRHKAIERALDYASKDDIVVIAGKGHERYQIIKDKMIPFDDREVARSILSKKRRYEDRRDIKDNSREVGLGQA